MSMPIIDIGELDRDLVINNVIASIALQEAALSHILNADGEKLQAAIHLIDPEINPSGPVYGMDDLLKANASVNDMVETAKDLEEMLRDKLNAMMDFITIEEDLPELQEVTFTKTFEDEDGEPVVPDTTPFIATFTASGRVGSTNSLNTYPIMISRTAQNDPDSDDVVTFMLPEGVYTLLETKTPDGFIVDNTRRQIVIMPTTASTTPTIDGVATVADDSVIIKNIWDPTRTCPPGSPGNP